jgi:hypothetical protein
MPGMPRDYKSMLDSVPRSDGAAEYQAEREKKNSALSTLRLPESQVPAPDNDKDKPPRMTDKLKSLLRL